MLFRFVAGLWKKRGHERCTNGTQTVPKWGISGTKWNTALAATLEWREAGGRALHRVYSLPFRVHAHILAQQFSDGKRSSNGLKSIAISAAIAVELRHAVDRGCDVLPRSEGERLN